MCALLKTLLSKHSGKTKCCSWSKLHLTSPYCLLPAPVFGSSYCGRVYQSMFLSVFGFVEFFVVVFYCHILDLFWELQFYNTVSQTLSLKYSFSVHRGDSSSWSQSLLETLRFPWFLDFCYIRASYESYYQNLCSSGLEFLHEWGHRMHLLYEWCCLSFWWLSGLRDNIHLSIFPPLCLWFI